MVSSIVAVRRLFVIRQSLTIAAVGAAMILAGCHADRMAGPPTLRSHRNGTICVRPARDSMPADTVPVNEDGSCNVGFDNIPWY